MLRRSFVPFGALIGLLLLPRVGHPGVAAQGAQIATVRVERESFRVEPAGNVLAAVVEGAPLELGREQGRWRAVVLEGWVPVASVREDRRFGHDLIVEDRGETLRSAPEGRVRGWLRPGMRLDRMEQLGDWVRVRREGWIWQPSLALEGRNGVPERVVGPTAAAVAAQPREAPEQRRPASPDSGRRGWAVAGPRGGSLLESPAGDSLAGIRPGVRVQVVAREGDWTRVRIEGWTRTATLTEADPIDAAILEDVDPATLASDPDRFRGRTVAWDVQFIALQQAERFRADFVEGEPFMLTRGPGDGTGFVYAAVPPSLLAEVRALEALDRVRVVGRIRTARSGLTGAPVLELLEIGPPSS